MLFRTIIKRSETAKTPMLNNRFVVTDININLQHAVHNYEWTEGYKSALFVKGMEVHVTNN